LPAADAIRISARFVLGHEFGHHVVRCSRVAEQFLRFALRVASEKMTEPLDGTPHLLHAVVKPSSEYTFDTRGNSVKWALRGDHLMAASAHIEATAAEELVADYFGLMFATHYARHAGVEPGLLLQSLHTVLEDLLMNQLIRAIVDQTPRSGVAGVATFDYGRYAYRLTSMHRLIEGALLDLLPVPSTRAFISYWAASQAQQTLERVPEAVRLRAALFDQLDIVARAGMIHAVMPERPPMPDFSHLPAHIRGAQSWLYAPLSVPAWLLDSDLVFNEDIAAKRPPLFVAFANACHKVARATYAPESVHETYGDQYRSLRCAPSEAKRFEQVRRIRLDVFNQETSFAELASRV
jgi:hypothetical protein